MIDAVTLLSILLVISSVVMVAIAWHHDRTIDKLDRANTVIAIQDREFCALEDDYYAIARELSAALDKDEAPHQSLTDWQNLHTN
jgi:hypothetical protein